MSFDYYISGQDDDVELKITITDDNGTYTTSSNIETPDYEDIEDSFSKAVSGNVTVTFEFDTFGDSGKGDVYISNITFTDSTTPIVTTTTKPVSSYTFSNVGEDHILEATFNKAYTITATAGANGSITPSGSTEVFGGENQTFTITPNEGYAIEKVLVDNVAQTQQGTKMIQTITNYSYNSSTYQDFFTTTGLVSSGSSDWHFASAQGISYCLEGIVEKNNNPSEDVTITFTGEGTLNLDTSVSDNGYLYICVTDDSGSTEYDSDGNYSLNVNGNVEIYIELSTDEDSDGEAYDDADATIYIEFENVETTTQTVVEPVNSYTFTNVTGNHTISATFKEDNSYPITYNLKGGTATGNPTKYTSDDFAFTLNNPTLTNYTFTGWTGSNGNTKQTTVTIKQGTTGALTYTANYRCNLTHVKCSTVDEERNSYWCSSSGCLAQLGYKAVAPASCSFCGGTSFTVRTMYVCATHQTYTFYNPVHYYCATHDETTESSSGHTL